MDHEAYVRLVDAHPESNGCNYDVVFAGLPFTLYLSLLFSLHACVVVCSLYKM